MRNRNFKTAIVHEWLSTPAGSERVLEEIYNLYPSPIYSLIYDKSFYTDSPLSAADIHTSFIQNLPFGKTKYRSYLPFFPLAVEGFNLDDYDVILSNSHAVAKGLLKRSDQLHICYCCTPMRYIWDITHQYLRDAKLTKGFKSFLVKIIFNYLRIWDVSSANRVDYFIADSKYVASRINNIYRRDAAVIYPPVDVDSFKLVKKKGNYYLAASRMVAYKKLDVVVEAFSRMKDKRLVLAGDGPDEKKIKKLASKNIEMVGRQSKAKLIEYMGGAKAFLFAALEDFGIMPVEAQACGTPVIAYGRGGASETVIKNKTGIFFHEQTPEAIIDSVNLFEKTQGNFYPETARKNALNFSKESFIGQYKNFVEKAKEEFFAGSTRIQKRGLPKDEIS